MTRTDALNAAATYGDTRFVGELAALVAHPTESQRSDTAPALRRYLTEAMAPRLQAMGFETTLHDNPDPRGGPFLTALRIEAADLPTILIYGHGDVTHGQAGDWAEGRDPFTLSQDGDRLYGRGAADNKCQHLINIAALDAVLATRGSLGFNCKIVLEMSEEIGSPGLGAFIAANATMLSADVLIASDGPRLQPGTPTVFLGARGSASFDLIVDLRPGAHHSGNWGGLLADPAQILAHALACITDARGTLLVPEWRPNSLTPDIRAALADLPIDLPSGPTVDQDWGTADLTPAERVFGWNSFAVLAMSSGVPSAPQNAISGRASARCQLRFVVGTDVERIVPALQAHLVAHGFTQVTVTPTASGFFPATRHAPDHPWVRFVTNSIVQTSGQTPHLLPNLAGSLPNHVFTEGLGLPTIWIPHSYRGCAQHAPDEHALLSVCTSGLQLMAGLFWDIGATGGPNAS